MTGLAEFLRARLDEDEAAARESHYEGQRWLTEEEGVYRWPDDELVHMADRKADARHIARHDPARVLREVEAKRAILAEHEPEPWRKPHPELFRCSPEGHEEYWTTWPCVEVRAIAAIYSDHPDYDPGWKIIASTDASS